METLRVRKGFHLAEAAARSECSMDLLRLLENDDAVTLPSLALQIAAVYGMTRGQCAGIGKALPTLIHGCGNEEPLPVPPIEADKLFYMRLPLFKAGKGFTRVE